MICVLGMHRSGTSALTGVVEQLGAFLGPPAHLMAPRADNPAGFFEHQPLTDLNDEILRAHGGVWQAPPLLPAGWADAAALDDIRRRAAEVLAADFAGHRLTVWKDPRACLTLAFWRPLLPRVKTVVCVRHPLEVARSLLVRDGLDVPRSIDLWMRYMSAAVAEAGDDVLVVAYDDLLRDPDTAVARLAAFIDPAIGEAARAAAAAHVGARGHLRHHADAMRDLASAPDVPFAVTAFYALLVALARTDPDGRGLPADLRDAARVLAATAPVFQAAERSLARLGGAAGPTALPAALTSLQAARDEVARLEADAAASRLEARQATALVASVHTPLGLAKAIVRMGLPTPILERVRAWRRRRGADRPSA